MNLKNHQTKNISHLDQLILNICYA